MIFNLFFCHIRLVKIITNYNHPYNISYKNKFNLIYLFFFWSKINFYFIKNYLENLSIILVHFKFFFPFSIIQVTYDRSGMEFIQTTPLHSIFSIWQEINTTVQTGIEQQRTALRYPIIARQFNGKTRSPNSHTIPPVYLFIFFFWCFSKF